MAKVTITIEDNEDATTDSVCFVEAKTEWTPEQGHSKAVLMAAAMMNLIEELSKEEAEIKAGGTD